MIENVFIYRDGDIYVSNGSGSEAGAVERPFQPPPAADISRHWFGFDSWRVVTGARTTVLGVLGSIGLEHLGRLDGGASGDLDHNGDSGNSSSLNIPFRHDNRVGHFGDGARSSGSRNPSNIPVYASNPDPHGVADELHTQRDQNHNNQWKYTAINLAVSIVLRNMIVLGGFECGS